MGATTFCTEQEGSSADAAFHLAIKEAQHEFGHGGYSGTVAEKHEYVMVRPLANESNDEAVDRILDGENHPVCDKWGPAGCIRVSEGKYLFFGWASC